MEYELTLHGMHCESCEKIIRRAVARHQSAEVRELDVQGNKIRIECREDQLASIRKELTEKGYQLLFAGESPNEGFEAGAMSRGLDFLAKSLDGAPGFEAEHKLIKYSLSALVIILLTQMVLYLALFNRIPKFIDTYWSVTLLSSVSVVALIATYYQADAFRKKTSCMTGMMVGMTFGMAGGFLIGAFVGATNGMFVGSIVGMVAGMGLGYYSGKCCGVMGAMEGLMGGLMAGTMGAMLSVMMIYDNLIPFLFILTAVELVIMAAFSYMIFKEHGNLEGRALNVTWLEFIVVTLAFDLALTAVYVFAPKAGVVLGAGGLA